MTTTRARAPSASFATTRAPRRRSRPRPELSRRLVWLVVGAGIAITGAVGVCSAAAGLFGAGLWHAVAAAMIVLAAAASAAAGLELVARRRLAPLGWLLLASAPAEAAVLLVANWREHVSRGYAQGLITATVCLLSGVVVGVVRLSVPEGSLSGRRAFAALVACLVALDALALVVTWSNSLPGEALQALLTLVFAALVLALLTPLAQRL